jgi:hypothetical protein
VILFGVREETSHDPVAAASRKPLGLPPPKREHLKRLRG